MLDLIEEKSEKKFFYQGYAVVCTDFHGVVGMFPDIETAEQLAKNLNNEGGCKYLTIKAFISLESFHTN